MEYPRNMLIFTILCVVPFVSCKQYVYYMSPGGSPFAESQGLYGSASDYMKGSAALEVPDSGYQCIEGSEVNHDSLPIRSLSFDTKTRRVLMKLDEKANLLTLIHAAVCVPQDDGPCANATNRPEFLFEKAQVDFAVGPFAYFDEKIYFLYGLQDTEGHNTQRSIQLRVFEGCVKKYPVRAWTSFYIKDCSRLIATLANDEYERFPGIIIGGHLLAVDDSSELYFLTQVSHVKYNEKGQRTDEFTMELLSVRGSDGLVTSLYNATLDTKFLLFDIHLLGGISRLKSTLCWSALDSIMCADWKRGGKIKDTRVVLPKGNATLACENTRGNAFTGEVVTGVAVAQHGSNPAVYFGCIAEVSGSGGAGLVRMNGNKRSVYKLETTNGTIYAGSMFLVNNCNPDPYDVTGGGPAKGDLFAKCIAVIALTVLLRLLS